MSEFDAHEGMKWVSGLSDREIERVLAGRVDGDEELEDLADFVADVRGAYGAPPTDSVARRHVALIAAAAAAHEQGAKVAADVGDTSARASSRRTVMPSHKRIARATIVLCLVGSVVTGSLAAAGVDMPILPRQASDEAREAVARAAERVDQRADSGTWPDEGPPTFLEELQALLESVPPAERGCEFGQRIATIASGSDPTEGDPCAEGEGRGSGGGNAQRPGGDAPGQGAREQHRPPQGGPETGNQASGGIAGQAQSGGAQGGREVGEQVSGGGSSGAAASTPPVGGGGGAVEGPPASVPPAAQPGQGAAANAPAGPGRP